MKTVEIKEREVRGVTFLDRGQQYTGWVPKGSYSVLGECHLTVSELGKSREVQAVKIQGKETWYVGKDAMEASS